MEINVTVSEFNKNIIIDFIGRLDMGEEVDMYTEYDMNGKIINCHSIYSPKNIVDYYLEMVHVFNIVKDLEGERIKTIIKELSIKRSQFDTTLDMLNKEIKDIEKSFNETRIEYLEIKSKLNKCKYQKDIEDLNILLNQIESLYLNLLNTREFVYEVYSTTINKFEREMKLKII